MSKAKASEVKDIRKATGDDPGCAICHRRTDRRYMDEIWEKAKHRAAESGSASVRITR